MDANEWNKDDDQLFLEKKNERKQKKKRCNAIQTTCLKIFAKSKKKRITKNTIRKNENRMRKKSSILCICFTSIQSILTIEEKKKNREATCRSNNTTCQTKTENTQTKKKL